MTTAYPNCAGSLPLQTLYIELFDCKDEYLSHGTGFLVHIGCKQIGLITARHNLTALDIFTGQKIGRAPPKKAKVWIPRKANQSWVPFEIDLENKPWIDFETFNPPKPKSDVVIILLHFREKAVKDLLLFTFRTMDEVRFSDWQTWRVGMPMTILGYPIRRSQQKSALGIAGQLASEPRIDFQIGDERYPMYLVSARTWSGMSGGPVVPFQGHGGYFFDNGEWTAAAGGGEPLCLGLYGGRLTVTQNESSDLGLVWRICWLINAVYHELKTKNSYTFVELKANE